MQILELKSISEMKNLVDGVKIKLNTPVEWNNAHKIILITMIKFKVQRDKWLAGNEHRLGDLCDNIKQSNIHVIGVPVGEGREKGAKNSWKLLTYGWK